MPRNRLVGTCLQSFSGRPLLVDVVFVPVVRDEFIPALLEGRGDVTAANLAIAPERLKKVDLSDPWCKNASEIIVTARGVGRVPSVQDLSGKEVYIRKTASFDKSIEKLNAHLKKAGKAPAKVKVVRV